MACEASVIFEGSEENFLAATKEIIQEVDSWHGSPEMEGLWVGEYDIG